MKFFQLKTIIIRALLGLIAALLILDVNAARGNTKQTCKELLCPTAKETGYNKSQCFMHDSTATFVVDDFEQEREYYGLLVTYNQTLCKAFLLLNINHTKLMQEIITKCCSLVPSQGHGEKNTSHGNPEGSSARFQVKLEPHTDGVLIFMVRNVSLNTLMCLRLGTYRPNHGICTAYFKNPIVSRVPFTTTGENLTNITRQNPTSILTKMKTRDRKATEAHHLMTYCLVVTFLLLEVFVCVILYFCSWKKCWRTHQAENSATNPIYLQGVQISELSPSTAQDSYQPLVVNTREPGASDEYRGLESGGRDEQVGVPVDPTSYQDLVQRNQSQKYQSLVVDSTVEGNECSKDHRKYDEHEPKENVEESDASPSEMDPPYSTGAQPPTNLLDSLRNLARSAISRRFGTSSFSPNNPQPRNSSPLDKSATKPLHYPLEGPETRAEKGPACPDTNPKGASLVPLKMRCVIEELKAVTTDATVDYDDKGGEEPFYHVLEGPDPTLESNRHLMCHVLEELKILNANGPKGESSSDFCAEPLYAVLEDPKDLKDKNKKDENL